MFETVHDDSTFFLLGYNSRRDTEESAILVSINVVSNQSLVMYIIPLGSDLILLVSFDSIQPL